MYQRITLPKEMFGVSEEAQSGSNIRSSVSHGEKQSQHESRFEAVFWRPLHPWPQCSGRGRDCDCGHVQHLPGSCSYDNQAGWGLMCD